MYKYRRQSKSLINNPVTNEGEPIEIKVRRMVENKEPIKDGAPLLYTDRKEGVMAAYNIRTDRFEIATDAMDKVTKSKIAKREEPIKDSVEEKTAKIVDMSKNGGAEPVPGKADKNQSK